MTTQVIIKSPRPNHLAVKVEALDPVTGEPNGYGAEVLGDGDGTARFYVHSGSALRITEVPKEDVLPSARELTFGEKAVGQNFNPSGDHGVANCKDEFAAVINRMNALRNNTDDPEVKRMASIAITEAQTAQMWAVKALTWRF
jgi:hypothetical protein